MKLSRKYAAVVLLAVLVLLTGCANKNQHITNLPPNVSEKEVKDWYAAVGALSQVASVVDTSTQFLIQVNQAKAIPGYVDMLRAIGRIDQGGIVTKNFLEQAPHSFGTGAKNKAFTYADEALKELTTAEQVGLGGVSNPDSKQKLATFFDSLRTSLMTIKLISQINAVNDSAAPQEVR